MNAQKRMATREAVLSGSRVTSGTFVGLSSMQAAEICARAGIEWLLIDLEHGAGTETELAAQLHASARFGGLNIVRVEEPSRIRVSRALDLGADGVMLPRLDSAAQVAEAVKHLRYPSEGDRGVATYHSAAGYGLEPDYFQKAAEVVSFVQIETAKALDECEAIAEIPGVDVLFVGPRDLSTALGVEPVLDDPVFRDACRRVVQAAQRAGKTAGILVGSVDKVAGFTEFGFSNIAVGSDSGFLVSGAVKVVEEVSRARSPR